MFIRLTLIVVWCLILLVCVNLVKAETPDLVDYVSLYNETNKPKDYNASNNAAEDYQKAIEVSVKKMPKEITSLDWEYMEYWLANLPPPKLQTLKQWLEKNRPALAHLTAGTEKPYLWIERESRDGVLGIIMPEIAGIRELTNLLCLKAKLEAMEGNIEEATKDTIAIYRLGNHYNNGPKMPIEQVFGTKMKEYAIQTALLIIQNVKLTEEERESIYSSLQKYISEEDFKPNLMVMKFISLDSLQRMYTVNQEGNKVLNEEEAQRQRCMLNLNCQMLTMLSGGASLVKYRDLKFTQMEYQDAEALLLNGLKKLEELIDLEAWQLKVQINEEGNVFQKIQDSHPILNTLFLEAVNMKVATFEKLRAQTRSLETIMAVLKFKEDRERLPIDLDELVKEGLLEKVPLDPFSGKAIGYKKTGEDFTIYSYGVDFDDDNGERRKPFAPGASVFRPLYHLNGDLVIWPVESPANKYSLIRNTSQ